MRKILSHKFWGEYSLTEWKAVKISLAYLWVRAVMESTIDHNQIPYPCGIFSFIDGSVLVSKYTVFVFFLCSIVLAVFYLAEKRMAVTTLLMFLLSLVMFTLEESSGIQNRNSLYTMIFLVQSIAYYRHNERLSEERVQFPIQIIAAGYMLAGLSKLEVSGLHWVTDSPLISIQILKSFCNSYFDSGNSRFYDEGMKSAHFILEHRWAMEALLAGSLFLELFAWVAVKNKLSAFVYGLLLFTMHMGILHFMNILIVGIYYPMLIFMINPLYFFYPILAGVLAKFRGKATQNSSI